MRATPLPHNLSFFSKCLLCLFPALPSLSILSYPWRSRLRSFNISHWLHSQFTPEIARQQQRVALNGGIVVPVGDSDSTAPASGHNGSLKAWNNLTKRMGFASADYHRSATQASKQTNQPTDQSTPHQPDQLKQHCFWVRLQPTSAKLRRVHCTLVQWQQLSTSWSAHLHTHMQHPRLVLGLDLFFGELLCHNMGISAVWPRTRDAVNTLLFSHLQTCISISIHFMPCPTALRNLHIVVV